MNSFATKLKKWRIDNNINQEEAANMLNYGIRAFQEWERGHSLPSFDAIISIASIMNVSADWLLGLTDESASVNDLLRSQIISSV